MLTLGTWRDVGRSSPWLRSLCHACQAVMDSGLDSLRDFFLVLLSRVLWFEAGDLLGARRWLI